VAKKLAHFVLYVLSYYAVTENPGRRSEWRGQTFDPKLLSIHFYACEVKMCPKLAYPVVKSPTF